MRTVSAEPLPGGYGYVRITQFSDSTPGDLDLALASLRPAGAQRGLRGLVLDLRGNPGGVLESATGRGRRIHRRGDDRPRRRTRTRARFEIDATPGDALDGAPSRRARRRRFGVRLRDRRRGAARPRPRHADGRAHLRQGLGADRHSAASTARRSSSRRRDISRRPASRSTSAGSSPTSLTECRDRSRAGRPACRRATPRQAALQYLQDRGLGPQLAQAARPADR